LTFVDKGVHGLGHGEENDPIGHRRNIRRFHIDQIARLTTRLQNTPEGDGNMVIAYSQTLEKSITPAVRSGRLY